jgi:hypothetical protein
MTDFPYPLRRGLRSFHVVLFAVHNKSCHPALDDTKDVVVWRAPVPAYLRNRDGNRWLTARPSFKLTPAV